MATFLLFGKYSAEGIKGMSAQRTGKAVDLIKGFGGEVEAMYATLGEYDLVFVVSLPDNEAAVKTSVALGKATGIGFTTAAAVTVEEFDKLTADI